MMNRQWLPSLPTTLAVILGALIVVAAAVVTGDDDKPPGRAPLTAGTLTLTVVAQTTSTVTFSYPTQEGFGYLFSTKASETAAPVLVSRTNDPSRSTVKFSKGSYAYEVATSAKGPSGVCVFTAANGCGTAPPPPPPPPPGVTECSDGIDNDGNGHTDFPDDSGCLSTTDTDEAPASPPPPPPPPPPPSPPPPPPPGGTAPWLGSFNASYQSAQPGQTITVPAGTYSGQSIQYRASLANVCTAPTGYVIFDVPNTVTINGDLVITGPCIHIKGRSSRPGNPQADNTYTLNVIGEVRTNPTFTSSQYADHVLVEGVNARNFGIFNATDVTFRDMDIGPATLGAGCGLPENKVGTADGVPGPIPKTILIEALRIHDQNADAGAQASDCHYGGLFIINADGMVIRRSVFSKNVVYNVQVQNFSGPESVNVTFESNSFGCPVEWLSRGDLCDGQKSIQFNDGNFGSWALVNNVSANGTTTWNPVEPSGLWGCQAPTCTYTGMVVSGNVDLAPSTTAPPLPAGG